MNEDQCCNSEPQLTECRAEQPMPVSENRNRANRINIEQLDLGYIVTVGCQKFAIESSDKLVDALSKYLKDPSKVEKEWYDGKFLK